MDFTLSKYEQLLKTIIAANLPVYTVKQWITEQPSRGILLRHDVDRLPGNALAMAALENRFNIRATYYFRIAQIPAKKYIIRKIARAGHEIGYHYEELAHAHGNYSRALALFEKNIAAIRRIADVSTIAMHGSPLSRYNNADIWKESDFARYGICGDAMLSIDYTNMYYFSDAGRTWERYKNNIRDYTHSSKKPSALIATTDDLIDCIHKNPHHRFALTVHPERWNDALIMWALYRAFDYAANSIKAIIKSIR